MVYMFVCVNDDDDDDEVDDDDLWMMV